MRGDSEGDCGRMVCACERDGESDNRRRGDAFRGGVRGMVKVKIEGGVMHIGVG